MPLGVRCTVSFARIVPFRPICGAYCLVLLQMTRGAEWSCKKLLFSFCFSPPRKHGEGFFPWVRLSCSHESHCKASLQGIIIMKVIARSHCKESFHESHCKESLQGGVARSHCKESLQGVIARSHCKESLQGVIARSHESPCRLQGAKCMESSASCKCTELSTGCKCKESSARGMESSATCKCKESSASCKCKESSAIDLRGVKSLLRAAG